MRFHFVSLLQCLAARAKRKAIINKKTPPVISPTKSSECSVNDATYPAEGPRIDIIRFMLQAVLNQNRYLFTLTPQLMPLANYRLNR